jgi:hypothetical protein
MRGANGRRARIIIEDPDDQVEPLLGIDVIEVRASPAGEGHVLYRADDEMLLVFTRIGATGASPPIIHLRRLADGGLFDRLAHDFDHRWLKATPLTSREQLHAYLADTELEPWAEPERSPEADPYRLLRPRGHPRRPPRRPRRRRAAGHDDPADLGEPRPTRRTERQKHPPSSRSSAAGHAGLRLRSGEVQQPPCALVDQLDDPPEDGRIPARFDQLLSRVVRRAGRIPRHPTEAPAGSGGTEPSLVEQAVEVPRAHVLWAVLAADAHCHLPRQVVGLAIREGAQ